MKKRKLLFYKYPQTLLRMPPPTTPPLRQYPLPPTPRAPYPNPLPSPPLPAAPLACSPPPRRCPLPPCSPPPSLPLYLSSAARRTATSLPTGAARPLSRDPDADPVRPRCHAEVRIPAEAATERRAGAAPVSAPSRPRRHAVSARALQAGSAVAGAACIWGRAAVTCRRALLLHSQHQWPRCWAA
jgi:hypothetical protein